MTPSISIATAVRPQLATTLAAAACCFALGVVAATSDAAENPERITCN